MLSILWRRSVLTLSSIIINRHSPSLSSFSPAHLSRPSFPKPNPSLFVPRAFQSTNASVARVYDNDEEMQITPDKLLAEGCDYNHWLVTMDFPDDPRPSPQEMVDAYVETSARLLGSVEEAKKKIYACSTTTYTGFQVEVSEEVAKSFQGLPDVAFVVPDSYIDPVNKQYGGDKYDNGIITHRRPPEQDERQEEQVAEQNTDFNRPSHPRDEYQQRNPADDEGTTQATAGNFKPRQNSTSQQNYGPPRVAPVNKSARGQDNYQGQFSKKKYQGQMRDRKPPNQRTYIKSQRGDFYPQGQSMLSGQFNNNAPQQGVKSQGAGGKENYQGQMRDQMLPNQESYIQSKRVDSCPQCPSMPSAEFNDNAPRQGVKWQGAGGGQVNYQGQIRDQMLPTGGSYIRSQRRDSYPQGQSMPSGEFDNNTPQQGVKWQGAGGQVNHKEQMRDQLLPTGGSYIQSRSVDSYPQGPSMPSGEFNNNAPQQGVKWQGTRGQVNYQGQIRDQMFPTGGSYIQSQRRKSYPEGQSMPSGEFDNNTPQQSVIWQGGQVNHQEQMRDQMLPTGGSYIQSQRRDFYPQGQSMLSGEFNNNTPQQGVKWQGAGGQVNYQGQMRDQMLSTGGSYIQSQRSDSYPEGQSMPSGEFNNNTPQQGVKWQDAGGQINYQGQRINQMFPNGGSYLQSQRRDSHPQGQIMPPGEFNNNTPQHGAKWEGIGGQEDYQGQMRDLMHPNQESYIESQRGDSYPQGQSMPLGEFNRNAPQQGVKWQSAGGQVNYLGEMRGQMLPNGGSYIQTQRRDSYPQGHSMLLGEFNNHAPQQGVKWQGAVGHVYYQEQMKDPMLPNQGSYIQSQRGDSYPQGQSMPLGEFNNNAPQQGFNWQGAGGSYVEGGQGAGCSYVEGASGNYWQGTVGSYGQGGGCNYGPGAGGQVGGGSYVQDVNGSGQGLIHNYGQGSSGNNGRVFGGNFWPGAGSNYGQGVGSNYWQGTTGIYEQGASGIYGQGASGSYAQGGGGGDYWQGAGGQGGGGSYGKGGGFSYLQALRGAGLGVIHNHGQGSGGNNGHVPGDNFVAAACSKYGQGVGSNYGQGTTGSYEQGCFGSYWQGATDSYEQGTGGVVPGQEQFSNYGYNNFVHHGSQRFSLGEWMNDLQQVQQ